MMMCNMTSMDGVIATRSRPRRGNSGLQFQYIAKDVRIDWSKTWSKKHLNALKYAYAKAPYFQTNLPWLETIYSRHDEFLADFTVDVTIELSYKLGIKNTRFIRSSQFESIQGEKTDRLIQILKRVDASHYISGPSAKEYIEETKFLDAGISLEFMEYNYPEYTQLHPPYDPNVTILDLIFMEGENAANYLFV